MAEGQQKGSVMAGEERKRREEADTGGRRQTDGRGNRERIRFPGLF